MTTLKELTNDISEFLQEFKFNSDKFNDHVIQYDILLNNMKDMKTSLEQECDILQKKNDEYNKKFKPYNLPYISDDED